MAFLTISTPNTQLSTDNGGVAYISRLKNLKMNGDKSRKIFTIECTGPPGFVSTDIILSQGGTGNAFTLFPSTSGNTVSLLMSVGDKASFSVDYDSSLGTGVTASISSTATMYGGLSASYIVLDPVETIDFDIVNPEIETKREIGPLLNVNEDGDYIVDQASAKITQDETSFGVLRANPKLSGNVKITIDSANDIWLNSIDAEKELSDDRFKKYRIRPNSSYAIDINRFFDFGKTPSEIVYSLYEADTQYTSTKRTFSEQYDRFYQYGVTQLNSKFYPEDFVFFAPLYLKTEIPEYFVIFRTDGPVNSFTYETPASEWSNHLSAEILAKSKIIKTFSLSDQSPIGQYLRNIVEHPSRRESDITVSYQKDGYTTFNGISYEKGTYAQMGELLYDYVNQENPLTNVEEFTTLGFQRNKVLSSHLINLEFLFDDDEAPNYSINRYFGLYVNAIDLAKFNLNAEALDKFSVSLNQTPLPRKGIDGTKISQKPFVQSNTEGVKIFAENSSIERIPEEDPFKLYSSMVKSMSVGATSFEVKLDGNFYYLLENSDDVVFTSGGLTATAILNSFTYENDETVLVFDNSTYISTVTLSLFSTFSSSCNFYSDRKYTDYKARVFDSSFIQNVPRLFYVKDNLDKLHSVSATEQRSVYIDPFTPIDVTQISLKDNKTNITSFTGFSSLLTQTDAIVLDSRGRSSISLEIKDYFSANDFIEIRWEPGPTALGYPLRWKVVANDTNINPGESWPASTIATDIEGEYYLAYFNPGDSTIDLTTFVKSIEQAFGRFEFKDFEVLAKSTSLYFRSTQDGKASEAASVKIYTQDPNIIDIMGLPTENLAVVNFIGGSDRKRTRARISKTVAEGMFIDEYLSTKGSFSNIRSYSIEDQTIVFSPYLEEPVYDEDGEKLIDFLHSEDYMIISTSDEKSEIQLTSDSRLITYELYKPTYGVLSILPIKDFDTDFYSSQYSRDYTPELVEYFARAFPNTTINSISGITYTFSESFEFSEYPIYVPFLKLSIDGVEEPTFYNADAQFLFMGPGATADIVFLNSTGATVGDDILLMPGEKGLYFTEDELSKFKGFLSLSKIVTSTDEQQFKLLENLWDPRRFIIQKIYSEYDRLAENYLKTLVLLSRVVPYSMKWVSPQGRDVRDNPYRLNYHRVFGNMSFSPSAEIQTPNPIYHTHEWPYLDSVPNNFPISAHPDSTFSYFFENLTDRYDFTSLKRDWFSQYFSTGFPVEKYKNTEGDYESIAIDPTEKYSFFNYEDFSDKTFTFFRGYRFQITELSEFTNLPILESKKYDNYRFSVIMKMEEEDPLVTQDPVEFKTIVNEKWKFIVTIITVRTSSYRFPQGKLRYTDLYTLQNSNDYAYYLYDSSYSATIPGFYASVPTDKKLSLALDLQSYTSDPNIAAYDYYDTYTNNADFIDNFSGQLLPLPDGNFSDIVALSTGGGFVSVNVPPIVKVHEGDHSTDLNTVQLSGNSANISYANTPLVFAIPLPFVSISWDTYLFYHQLGGNNTLKDIAERLSFFEIANVITGASQKSVMKYEIYKEDSVVLNTPNFTMTPSAPEQLTRIFDYFPTSDTDKPSEFYTLDNIGVVLNETKDLQSLYRYQGDFSPKFTDVLKFWLREDDEFTIITNKDYLFNNTHLAPLLKDFSIVKNQFFTKVSDTEILTISPTSGYKPVYPLIYEIAIDKQNLFAWSSSWDQNYYMKYNSTSEFTPVKGTSEMKEVKSLFGSKVMKVPEQYDLFEFTTKKVAAKKASKKNLTSTELNFELDINKEEITYYESDSTAIIQVDVYSRLLREMLGTSTDLRAKEEFIKVMNIVPSAFTASELDQKVKDYLIANILSLYEISDTKIFTLITGNSAKGKIQTSKLKTALVIPDRPLIETVTVAGIGNVSLSESELLKDKYVKAKDVNIVPLGNLKFQANFPLDSRFYTSISIGVTVKRI